ncbi:MAG: nitroreductase family protein [Spirochaetes bacterium]|nr:nitroreductase family protein [Spirochaetota bacterium]
MNRTITLPPLRIEMEFPLMKALAARRTKRKWTQSEFTDQELSNLLWAACGITHPASKKSKSRRTAPSACNSQEISVYIALPYGLYRYDEKDHLLIEIFTQDIRGYIRTRKMMKTAPAGLIYVSDHSKFSSFIFKDDERKRITSAVDTGFISQNVYLYAAAAKMNTAVLGLVDRGKLHEIMGLKECEKIVYTQAIGKA